MKRILTTQFHVNCQHWFGRQMPSQLVDRFKHGLVVRQQQLSGLSSTTGRTPVETEKSTVADDHLNDTTDEVTMTSGSRNDRLANQPGADRILVDLDSLDSPITLSGHSLRGNDRLRAGKKSSKNAFRDAEMANTNNNYPQHFFMLSRLVLEKKITLDQLTLDDDFQDMCHHITNHTNVLGDKQLLSLLKSLLVMGLDAESNVIKYLENELLFRAGKSIKCSLSLNKIYLFRFTAV